MTGQKHKERFDLGNPIQAMQAKNRLALIGFAITNAIILLAYFIEYLKGGRDISGFLSIMLLCVLPTVISYISFRKKKDSVATQCISTGGFCLLYTYIMFSTTSKLAFCYILVMFTLLTIYSNMRLSICISAYALLLNIVIVVKTALTTGFAASDIAEAEISIICVALTGSFLLLSASLTMRINHAALENSNREKDQTQAMLGTVLEVSKEMVQIIESVTQKMQGLDASINGTQKSMEDVAAGAQDAAESVQEQQIQTEEISEHIHSVQNITEKITDNVKMTEDSLQIGKEMMTELVKQVERSEEASKLVAKEMDELKAYTNSMQNILNLINSVASQTSLLALNASIEAARAGEAGKGFAVVASEISNLANQTSGATGEITRIIENIAASLNEVVHSVDLLLDGNKKQSEYINQTAGNIDKIQNGNELVFREAKELDTAVQTVSRANINITESIGNISAVTEEMTARAVETLEGSKKDRDSVEYVKTLIEQLNQVAEKLNVRQ
ncbi:MAG: hypothetical protein E7256_14720 [Lachnospiraceae bacterium]|nr:hypothetical protein [Lachnospiraceae bacterium]